MAQDFQIENGVLVKALNPQLKKVVIPKGVREIGMRAFDNFLSIEKLVIPEGVTAIGNEAFHNCRSLRVVELPGSLRSIGRMAFAHCCSLEKIDLPDGLVSLGAAAIEHSDELRSIRLPASLTQYTLPSFNIFDSGAGVDNCPQLKIEVDPDHPFLMSRDGILYDKTGKTLVHAPAAGEGFVIPEGIEEIGPYAFKGKTLGHVRVPDGVRRIGNGAFYSTNIYSIELPESVTEIGDHAFYWCRMLDRIVIPSGVRRIEHCTFEKCHAREIVFPDGLASVANSAFSECRKLLCVNFPASVQEISEFAFFKNPDVYLLVEPGSYAEAFAVERKLPHGQDRPEIPPLAQPEAKKPVQPAAPVSKPAPEPKSKGILGLLGKLFKG